MTTIYNTTTKELIEAEVVTAGMDFLADVMGGCGLERSERDDADFDLDDDDAAWWLRWAEREQRITDRAEELGEEADMIICGLTAEYGQNMELLQDMEERALGITD